MVGFMCGTYMVGLVWWDSCVGTWSIPVGAPEGNSFIFYVVAYGVGASQVLAFGIPAPRNVREERGTPLHCWRQRESKARGTRRSSVVGRQSSGKAHGADSVLTHSNVAQNATLEWGTVGPANRTSKPGPPAK